MTVTEPEVEPTSNGASAAPTTDGIDYLADGNVRFTFDGRSYTLRAPKIGTFRALHALWVSAVNKPPTEQLQTQLDFVRAMFNGKPDNDPPIVGLSDVPLPDDADTWPAWVGIASWQQKVMTWFRDVPLARGGAAPE